MTTEKELDKACKEGATEYCVNDRWARESESNYERDKRHVKHGFNLCKSILLPKLKLTQEAMEAWKIASDKNREVKFEYQDKVTSLKQQLTEYEEAMRKQHDYGTKNCAELIAVRDKWRKK